MAAQKDELTFEGAWEKQYQQEKEEPIKKEEEKSAKETQDVKFRGQKDMVENRSEFKMPSKPKVETEKKASTVVKSPSTKEGDDFDVEW